MDREISESLKVQMEAAGMTFVMNDEVAGVTTGPHVELRLKSGEAVQGDSVLISSGRCGQTGSLGLDRIGVKTNERGQVQVNDHYQTAVPHIYAAGDVIGNPSLASTSMEQARLAMVHAFDLKYRSDLAKILPYGIFTIPECSMAGQTEEQLVEAKIPFVSGTATYAANARGQIIGDLRGFIKLLFLESDMKLLGVHVIGEQATELVHVGLTALLMGAGADLFINTCYNYPTLTEVYKYATYAALGQQAARRRAREAVP
jgi:NAD(P) transhydrogenase